MVFPHQEQLADIFNFDFFLSFNLYILNFATPGADESTHSLLGLFYHDLFLDWLKKPTFSYSKLYDYGIAYMSFYPKLSVYYPPFFHFMIALSFFIFGISIYSAELVEVTFSVLTLLSVYLLGKELFDKKISLLSVIIVMISPIFILWSREAVIDIALMFFFSITAFFYLKWLKKWDRTCFILGTICSALGLLTKWQFLLIFPILFLYVFFKHRKEIIKLLLSFLLAALLISPYLYISFKAGFFELQYYSTVKAGADNAFPTWRELAGWNYYIEKLLFTQFFFPFSLLILLSFIFYLIKGEKHKLLFLIWFLVFYLFFVYADNKQDRFTMPYLQIFAIAFSAVFFNFLKKYKKYSKLLIFGLAILIAAQFIYSFNSLPRAKEPIEPIIHDVFEPGSNVLVAAYSSDTYESVFVFELARYDRQFSTRIYRYCSSNLSYIDSHGIKYVIISEPVLPSLKKYADVVYDNPSLFEKIREYIFENQTFVVYEYKGFKPSQNSCNYICLTNEEICSKYNKPIDALLS